MKFSCSSKKNYRGFSAGFTLIEMTVVISIFVTLLGFITLSLVRSHQTVSLTSTEEILVADLRQQQLKSMIGDTEGRMNADLYGIHFDSNRYVTFHGENYSSVDTSNSFFNLPSNIQFNSPNYDIIFLKRSGEIASPAIIDLQDKTNLKLKRIHINTYGTITQVESL